MPPSASRPSVQARPSRQAQSGGERLSVQAAWATQTLGEPAASPPAAARVSRGELALRARATPPAAAATEAAPSVQERPRTLSRDQRLSDERSERPGSNAVVV